MKQELQELISLTELFIYENYAIQKPKFQPVINQTRIEVAKPKTDVIKKIEVETPSVPDQVQTPTAPHALPKVEKDFSDIEKIFAKDLPHIKLLKNLPDDTLAKQKTAEWQLSKSKPIVYILTSQETEKELRFLQNVANAITSCFGTACVLPSNEFTDTHFHSELKLCLISKESQKFPLLQKNLIPICFLDKITDYFTNPSSKAILWKAISDQLI